MATAVAELPPVTDTPPADAPAPAGWSLVGLRIVDPNVMRLDPETAGLYRAATTVEMRLASTQALGAGLVQANRRAQEQARAALAETRAQICQTVPWQKWRRLQDSLDEVKEKAQAATWEAGEALGRAQKVLEAGGDPAKDEKAYRACKESEVIYSNRVAALEKLVADAEREAKQLLQANLESKRQELLAAAVTRWNELVAELATFVEQRLESLDGSRAQIEILDPASYLIRSRQAPHPLTALLTLPE